MVGRPTDAEGVGAVRFPAPPLEGVSGAVGALPWMHLTLAERQERALLECGVRFSAEPPARAWLALREDAAIAAATVRDFLAAVATHGGGGSRDLVARLGGRSGGLAEEIALAAPGEPLLAWLPVSGGQEITAERLQAAEVVTLDPQERMLDVPVPPEQFGASILELPLTERLLLPCHHWLQLLWVNLLGMPPFLWRELAGRNVVEVAWRATVAAVRAGSLHPMQIGAKLGRQGRGCRIHPSAVVEGSWLGDHVQIGANAVVRGCVLGDGSVVEDLALAEFSVMAAGARIQRQAMLKLSVAAPRASMGGVMQLGVLDQDAAVKRGALMMDMAFGQQLRVRHRGQLVEAPLGLAGVCVGARTLVGAGVKVAGGRALPPDLQIVGEADLVTRIPDGLAGRVLARQGSLEPL